MQPPAPPAAPVDFYEAMQISPNADSDTIHRIYRLLAQRFHPDNQETGSLEAFRGITEAYQTLGDSEKRAAYDVAHRETRRLTWKIFDQCAAPLGVDGERRKREGVLTLLYRKRIANPEQAFLTLREIEELLGVPREHLEFTVWYLREGQLIQRSDNGRLTITLKGVDLAEAALERKAGTISLLSAAPAAASQRVA
jgi:curved DNA-binding protein CbpA